jgi:hypothetical protein
VASRSEKGMGVDAEISIRCKVSAGAVRTGEHIKPPRGGSPATDGMARQARKLLESHGVVGRLPRMPIQMKRAGYPMS